MNAKANLISMDPLVSVITAVKAAATEFLNEAYQSLVAQVQVSWEWVLQFDDLTADVHETFAADGRVRPEANGQRLGASHTRNMALGRCRARLVFNLDADDVLTDNALSILVSSLLATNAAFAFGRVVDYETGAPTASPPEVLPFSDGEIVEPGRLERLWHTYRMPPVAGSSILWRKEFLFAYGGWAALSGSEDTAVIMSVALQHPTVFVDKIVLRYREHVGQTVATDHYADTKVTNWSFVHQRLMAMRAINGETVSPDMDEAPVPRTAERPLGGE